jgi:hypothetical protein
LILPPSSFREGRAALVIAHPGHELRVHGWLERARPRVFVLTDGSGGSGRPRLRSTHRTLARAGAEPGCIFGRLPDAAVYAALLRHNTDLFLDLTGELADALIRDGVTYLAGDAAEGYNPGHDVCRLMIDAAAERVRRRTGWRLANFDFPLIGPPDDPEHVRPGKVRLRLDDEEYGRKLKAAEAYPELAGEVAAALGGLGAEAFRVECLRPAESGPALARPPEDPPFYERYGEQQVRAGRYRQVLRYREHVLPLARALRRPAERGCRWAA